MRHQNLPTDMLRTFVAVAELKSFTRAGEIMGRTQPAVSLQIRRLEEILECRLLDTSGRVVALTPEGSALIQFARQMLALNDGAVAELSQQPRTGRLRVGLPIDYAVAFFQAALGNFMRTHAEVELEVYCDLSPSLLYKFEDGQLDIAIAMYERKRTPISHSPGPSDRSGPPPQTATPISRTRCPWSPTISVASIASG